MLILKKNKNPRVPADSYYSRTVAHLLFPFDMTDVTLSFTKDFLGSGVAAVISKMTTEWVSCCCRCSLPASKAPRISNTRALHTSVVCIPIEQRFLSFCLITWPMSTDTSLLRLSTWPSKINTSRSSWVVWTREPGFGATLQGIWHPVVPLGPHPCVLCILLILCLTG